MAFASNSERSLKWRSLLIFVDTAVGAPSDSGWHFFLGERWVLGAGRISYYGRSGDQRIFPGLLGVGTLIVQYKESHGPCFFTY